MTMARISFRDATKAGSQLFPTSTLRDGCHARTMAAEKQINPITWAQCSTGKNEAAMDHTNESGVTHGRRGRTTASMAKGRCSRTIEKEIEVE